MFGGLLKSTSLAALVAVAGVAISGSSAQAADLGGNCCADLEERIAELEATTARKGNRKVSLTISGQVNQSVLFWDDGVTKNAYVTDNEASRNRVRFLGSAKIDASWSAGYLLELGVRGNRQDTVSQAQTYTTGPNNTAATPSKILNGGADNGVGSKVVDVRHSVWWLSNKDLGKVWLGLTSDAADGITEINLANTGHFATPEVQDYLNGFTLRKNGVLLNNAAKGIDNNTKAFTYSSLWNGSRSGANPGEGDRFNVVKYDTPTIAGFIGSASWGENDQWAVGLRYAGEFSGFKLAAGIAYSDVTDGYDISSSTNLAQNGARGCAKVLGPANTTGSDVSCNELGLSASLMHVPTGLFVTGAYGQKKDDNRVLLDPAIRSKDEFYYVQGGIEQKFFPVGKSTFFGEYYNGKFGPVNVTPALGDTTAGSLTQTLTAASGLTTAFGSAATLTALNSSVEIWGVGFNQNIEAAAMDIYVAYRNVSSDATFRQSGTNSISKQSFDDFQYVTTGAVIKF